MAGTIELPRVKEPGSGLDDNWRVIVLNDDHNTFDGVASTLARVVPGITLEQGYRFADKIHNIRPGDRVGGGEGARGALLGAAQRRRANDGATGAGLTTSLPRVLRAAVVAALVLLLAVPANAAIRGPNGIDVQKVARGLGHPTALAFDPAGGMWTTSAQYGVTPSDGVWYVKRRGGRARHVVRNLNTALGLTWFRGKLFVSHVVPYSASGGHLHGPRHGLLALQRPPVQAPAHDPQGDPDGAAPREQHRAGPRWAALHGRRQRRRHVGGIALRRHRRQLQAGRRRAADRGARLAQSVRARIRARRGHVARLRQRPRRPRQRQAAGGAQPVRRDRRRRAALRLPALLGRGRWPVRRDTVAVRRARAALRRRRGRGRWSGSAASGRASSWPSTARRSRRRLRAASSDGCR